MIPIPEPLATLALLALGLVLGSFLNVCIHRLPRGESIVRPGSRCTSCGTPIQWYENVPILSWIVLRGRCSHCSAGISLRYPLVEAMSAGILVGFWRVYGPTWAFLIASLFTLALLLLFFTDLDLQLLPDAVTLTGFATGMALAWFNPFLGEGDWRRVWFALSGAALGSGFLWALGALYSKLRGLEAMGMGDVKMMAMVGAFTGPIGVLFTIFAASLVGALVGLALIPLRGRSLKDTLPFGCFLAPAALAALVIGRQAFDVYHRLLLPPF